MEKKYKVLFLEKCNQVGIEILEKKAEIYYYTQKNFDENSIIKELHGKDALFKRDLGYISKKVLEHCPTVKVVAAHGTGLDSFDIKGAEELGVYVVSTPFSVFNAVAEHNIGIMIALSKSIVKFDKNLREGNWNLRYNLKGDELSNKNVGFIGLGKIGYRTAEICRRCFDMHIYYYDIFRNENAENNLEASFVSIEKLCNICDFILMTLPLNKLTEKIFGKKQFDLMKPSAFFINSSRGPIVDEEALIEALENNKIAGAGIDVFYNEPPAKDNPLFKLDNVIVTPHIAGITKSSDIRMSLVVEDIIRVLEGEKPKYPANNPIC